MNLSNYNILLVDDDPVICKVLKKVIKKNICDQISIAENGLEAWDLYQKNQFSLVITDYLMPHVDGLELSYRILKDNKNAQIIMITGNTDLDKIAEKAKETGIKKLFYKPLDVEKFIQTISQIVN
jgi:two-component system sensor histidine kinase EvgS